MALLFRTLAVLPVVHVVNSAWTCPSGRNHKTGEPKCAGAVDSTCSTTACCDPVFADARCSDWNLMGCPSGKSVAGANSAPADSSSGMGLSQAKYNELCCVDVPITCSAYTAAWVSVQSAGGGCVADIKFFDDQKADFEVAAPQGDAEVKAACCTSFADALCNHWHQECPSGKYDVGTNSAPAYGWGSVLSQAQYNEFCCVDMPTPSADAQCSDWNLMGCPSGKYLLGTNSAPADSSDGKALSNDKYNELCCVDPMKCADYTGRVNSVSQATASLVVFVLVITAVMAHVV